MRDDDGQSVVVHEIDLVWWRRLTGTPALPIGLTSDATKLVANDCQAALLGALMTAFRGMWISPPEATRLAQNKLVQLHEAQAAGLRIPRTLVSQDPEQVRAFHEELGINPGVIVKPVHGAQDVPIMTGLVDRQMLTEQAITVSPAIYQEYIPGRLHLRVCCFGEKVVTALLESDALDWRYPLHATVTPFELDSGIAAMVLDVLKRLGLRMGIVDMKIGVDGIPVWLEVNPQGQFLFLEGMSDSMPLSRIFCDFLVEEALSELETS